MYTRVACIFIFQEYASPWRVPRYSLSAGLSYISLDRTRLDRDGSSSFPLVSWSFFSFDVFSFGKSKSFSFQMPKIVVHYQRDSSPSNWIMLLIWDISCEPGLWWNQSQKQVWEKIKPAIQLSLSPGRPALDIYILFPQLPFWFWHLEMNGRHLLSVCLCVYSLKGRIRAQNWLERNIWRSISADDTDTKIKGLDRGIWLKFECYIRRGFWLIEIFGGLFCIIWSRSDGCHRLLIKLETAVHTICYIDVVRSWWKYFI